MPDPFEGEEEEPGEEPEGWEEPIHCPVCGSELTRLVERRHEAGFYECESCGATFEEG